MTPRLVILESPFSGEIERNIAYGRWALADCLARGEAPIASHLLLTQPGVLDDTVAEERTKGIEAGLAWYAVADACVVYGDCDISEGMKLGIARAKKFKLPVELRMLTQFGRLNPSADLPKATWGCFGDTPGDLTPQEVEAAGGLVERRRIAEDLILAGVRRELAGDRRGGRTLAQEGDRLRGTIPPEEL